MQLANCNGQVNPADDFLFGQGAIEEADGHARAGNGIVETADIGEHRRQFTGSYAKPEGQFGEIFVAGDGGDEAAPAGIQRIIFVEGRDSRRRFYGRSRHPSPYDCRPRHDQSLARWKLASGQNRWP